MSEQNKHDDEFLAFMDALKCAAEMAGLDVPQIEIEGEEPDATDEEEFDDKWLLDDDEDYEDDLLDERYDGNRFPWYRFTFYQALEELKFQHENEDRNIIWYMTNGERALTFKDERLVDVRLAECVENLVYFSAPIQLKDLNDEWEVSSIADEEVQKIDKIVEIAETLKNENLAFQILDIIGLYI